MAEIVTVNEIECRTVALLSLVCLFLLQFFFGFLSVYRSIFQAGWATGRHPQHEQDRWGRVRSLRDDVNKALELARGAKILGSSLEGQVTPGLMPRIFLGGSV